MAQREYFAEEIALIIGDSVSREVDSFLALKMNTPWDLAL